MRPVQIKVKTVKRSRKREREREARARQNESARALAKRNGSIPCFLWHPGGNPEQSGRCVFGAVKITEHVLVCCARLALGLVPLAMRITAAVRGMLIHPVR